MIPTTPFLRTFVVRIAIVLVMAYVLLNLGIAVSKNYAINQTIHRLQSEIDALQQRIVVLHHKLIYFQSQSYRALETKRRLSLKAKGEQVVLVPHNVDPTSQNQSVSDRLAGLSVDQVERPPRSIVEQASENASTWVRWFVNPIAP
ncbi:hypothetical protein HY524_00220 [Candidatus Berkelbacteria bacterium]|nr:hypothetical protein [Candidatus Berkelbacteria bacterium]